MPFVIAESAFENFIGERLNELSQELSPVMGPEDVAKELICYIGNYSGKRVRVRMQSGHIQPHQAFNIEASPSSIPPIQLPQPKDEFLPLYSLEDFGVLDGLSRDFREKADDLGLPWDVALTIIRDRSGKDNAAAGPVEDSTNNPCVQKSIQEILRHRRQDVKDRILALADILADNPKASDQKICRAWDSGRITVLEQWRNDKITDWTTAFKSPHMKNRIHKMISGYRNLLGEHRRC